MASQTTAQQIIKIHILHNVSRSRSNQAMKFSQLAKYIMKHFSSKIMQKRGRESSPRPLFVF